MRLLVLNVDRDDDLGRKTGIRAPVLGREDMLKAATALAVADPEEADANGMFAAIKEYDEISIRKLEYDASEVFVGAVTGHIREGLMADNAVAQQFDEIMARTQCDAVILVSDGNEDEHVIPILQTRVKINGVRRVIVKQARTLEGVLGLFNRLIHDQKLQRRFFLPLAILLCAAGAAILFKRPELFVAAGLFLAAVYIMVQVLNLDRPLGGLMYNIGVQMRTGKVSLFASIIAFFLVVAGGMITVNTIDPASTVGTPRYSVLFAQAMFWYIVGAVALVIVGRGMDRRVRGEQHAGRHWEHLLFVLAAATLAYAILQVLDGYTRPTPLALKQLLNIEFLTWVQFAGFLLFTGLIARHYFEQMPPPTNMPK